MDERKFVLLCFFITNFSSLIHLSCYSANFLIHKYPRYTYISQAVLVRLHVQFENCLPIKMAYLLDRMCLIYKIIQLNKYIIFLNNNLPQVL